MVSPKILPRAGTAPLVMLVLPFVLLMPVDAATSLMRRAKPLASDSGTNTGKKEDVKRLVEGTNQGVLDHEGAHVQELVMEKDARSETLRSSTISGGGQPGSWAFSHNGGHRRRTTTVCNNAASEATCPDNCAWLPDEEVCVDTIDQLFVSGGYSREYFQAQKLLAIRPEFITTMHRHNGHWLACSDNSDCFAGWGGNWQHSGGGSQFNFASPNTRLQGNLSDSDIDAIRFDMHVTCEGPSSLQVKLICQPSGHQNSEVRLWYNLTEVEVPPCSTWSPRNLNVSIDPEDDYPILHVVVYRADSSIQYTRQDVHVRMFEVPAPYDACMEFQTHHGQCLEEMTGSQGDLRTNHTLQYECLVNKDDSINGCAQWRACLHDSDGLATLLTVLEAFRMTPSSLLQVADQPALHHGGITSSCTCIDDPSRTACADPETLDVEAFDCDCFDELQDQSATEINEAACARADICCDWKATHCATACTPTPLPTPVLLEARRTLFARRATVGSEVAHDLDRTSFAKTMGNCAAR